MDKRKFSFAVLSIFFILLTIPSLIAFTSKNMYPVKLMAFHQLLFFALYFFQKIKIDFNGIPVLNKKQALIVLLIVTTLGIIPYLYVYGPYINLKNLFLQDVYQTRSIMGALANPYIGYTYSPFTKIIVPLIIVFALELKNKLVLVIGILCLILFYLFGAHKTVYVGLIVLLVFYKLQYSQTVNIILKLSVILVVCCMVLAVFGYDYPWILTFRRIHFLPSLLDISYLDFFKDNYLFWSESVLKDFFTYPYDVRHEHLIADLYLNRPKTAANNGLISDGYMNMGTWGVCINIFIVSLYFMVLNSLKLPSKYFGLYLLVIFSFISSSLSIVLLTHGAIVLLLVSIFILNDKNSAFRSGA
ncbi:hypothetical protein K8352_00015 [Flavobacteriaceae bacterium F89]|uniref:O-antigen polymerase n=1 Tax=Cerina litoralis TaxID=2874477 RepID=A0AAE3ES26_9FLAO|nr:hypothetical protein [Cerina litoralis]MCG2459124.1 hypothetical protein [Cerina litoralis]